MSEFEKKLKNEFQDKEYAHAYMEDSLNHYIATQIKVLREQRGLTQLQLAELAGMKQERISVLENVDYESWSVRKLNQLAEAFDVALNVSFETFSDAINRIEKINRESLERLSREDDLFQQSQRIKDRASGNENAICELQLVRSSERSKERKLAYNAGTACDGGFKRSFDSFSLSGEYSGISSGFSSNASLVREL